MACTPEALSLARASNPAAEDDILCADAAASLIRTVATMRTVTTPQEDEEKVIEELRAAARADPVYVNLFKDVPSGIPSHSYNLRSSLSPYWKVWDELYTDGSLIPYGV